jgi:hypothetical protein
MSPPHQSPWFSEGIHLSPFHGSNACAGSAILTTVDNLHHRAQKSQLHYVSLTYMYIINIILEMYLNLLEINAWESIQYTIKFLFCYHYGKPFTKSWWQQKILSKISEWKHVFNITYKKIRYRKFITYIFIK